MTFEIKGEILYKNELISTEMLLTKVQKKQHWLRQFDMSEDKPVALIMNRTPLLIIVIFALLEQEIPFLPLDVQMPTSRLEYMMKTAKVEYVISDVISGGAFCGCKVLNLNDEPKDMIEKSIRKGQSELAYLLFTSGTTGYPKAVEVCRKGLINFVDAIPKCVHFPEKSLIACITSATFDIFFLESIMALCSGMTVVLADDKERNNPRTLRDIILKKGINALQMTPSMLLMMQMVDDDLSFLKGIDVLMLGGEPFPERLLEKLQGVVRGRIYNMYGPTETTIWSSVADLTETDSVNIGIPIQNTQIYIVADEKVLEDGEEGEIVIAGEGLARGYCNNFDKTNQNFVMMNCNGKMQKVYRTGDLGYYTKEHILICKGRKDQQVKILGNRIELGDVEENVRRIVGIENAVVASYGEDIKRLVCFYVGDDTISSERMEIDARKYLPAYMIPEKWIRVPTLLYTASGKADRNELIRRYFSKKDSREFVRKEVDEEVKIFVDYFSVKGKMFDIDDYVGDLLSDSIEYVEFIVYLEEAMDIEMEDAMLSVESFETMRDIYDYCKKLQEEVTT